MPSRWHSPLACLVAILIAPLPLCAEWLEFLDDFTKPYHCQRDPWEERIETERHDFTQSAITVGRGVVQAEGGYSFFYKDTQHEIENAHTTPEMLLRIGLTEDIEFRLRTNYVWIFINEEDDRKGSEDLRYSFKLQMTREQEDSWLPTSALEIRGSAPTGGHEFSTGQAEISLDYIYQWDVGEKMTFASSTGYGSDGFGDFGLVPDEPRDESFNVFTKSAVLGVEVSEDNTMYLEWFGLFSDGLEDEFVISMFNIGIDHYINKNVVIDVRVGCGLSQDSDDFFTGVGGGYRY